MSDPKYEHIGDPTDKLIEECAELIQALTKGKRFGWYNSHPNRPQSNNLLEVTNEIDDIQKAILNFLGQFK